MRVIALFLLISCFSCSKKNLSKETDICNQYYEFLRGHWSQEEEYLFKLKILDDIELYDNRNEAYLELNCLEGKNLKVILSLFGEPSKSIKVRDSGTIIYCLDKPCLVDFKAGGKYLWVTYQENIVSTISLVYFPIIHEEE